MSNVIDANKVKTGPESRNNYLGYLDMLRVIAAFAIVGLHVAAMSQGINNIEFGSYNWYVATSYGNILRSALVIFVMISGALFLRRDIEISVLYKKYIFRILVAYLFWNLIYSLTVWRSDNIKDILFDIIRSKSHMWYCLTAIGLYAVTPLLKKIADDQKMLKYYLILSFVIAIVLPELVYILRHTNAAVIKEFADILAKNYEDSNLNMLGGYIFYYLLGYYLSTQDFNSRVRKIIYVTGLVALVTGILRCFGMSGIAGQNENVLFDYFSVSMVLFVAGMFVFARYNFGTNKIITTISGSTFGIFLMHMAILRILDKSIKLDLFRFNSLFYIPVVAIGVFTAGLLITLVIKKIPVIGKYIV